MAPGKRTDGARGDRRIAAILFAAHPAAFDGVAWISSLSNIGLPLMLGSWLAFARGTTSDQVQWRAVWVSALLLGFALGFRESTLVVAGAMAVWRLVWWRRHRLRAWSSYAPLVPLAAVVVAYELIRTRFPDGTGGEQRGLGPRHAYPGPILVLPESHDPPGQSRLHGARPLAPGCSGGDSRSGRCRCSCSSAAG